jgi:hypothetical protein
MANSRIARTSVTVNLEGEQEVEITRDSVLLWDTRAYSPKLTAAMDLDSAVIFAKAVLAYIDRELPVLCQVCGGATCDCVTPGFVPNFVAPFGPNDLPC